MAVKDGRKLQTMVVVFARGVRGGGVTGWFGGGEGEGVGDVMDGHSLRCQYLSGRDWGR